MCSTNRMMMSSTAAMPTAYHTHLGIVPPTRASLAATEATSTQVLGACYPYDGQLLHVPRTDGRRHRGCRRHDSRPSPWCRHPHGTSAIPTPGVSTGTT